MRRRGLDSLLREPRPPDAPGPTRRDGILVATLAVVALLEGVLRDDVLWRPVVTLLALALLPTLLWRRRHPFRMVLIAFGTSLALEIASAPARAGGEEIGLYTTAYVLILLYALARWGSGREIGLGLAVVLTLWVVTTITGRPPVADIIGGFLVLFAVVALGAVVRYRADVARRRLGQVRAEERMVLARDLHDVVAHHVSAIAVQAQAGRAVASVRPEQVGRTLERIESEATRALEEMRAMVGVLRDGAAASSEPQRRLSDLPGLARSDPSPRVEVVLAGDLDGLSGALESAVHQMARESLTNALRYAKRATRITIAVSGDDDRVRLTVDDDGHVDGLRPAEPGYGILGMTERAELLGGRLRAGPRTGGGWTVSAELPRTGTP